MGFLALIPGLFTLLETVGGFVLTEFHKSSITSGILGLGSNLTSSGIMGVVTSVLGNIENEKVEAIKAQLETLLAQCQLNAEEAKEGFFYAGTRPTLFWGLTIITLIHLSIAEIFNIMHSLGYNWALLAPMDTLTGVLITGLCGLYIAGRTVEKISQ